MGQDSWNLQYGKSHSAKYRKGTQVDMHPDEGFAGEKMIPGYAGAYKNSKTKVIGGKKVLNNPTSMPEMKGKNPTNKRLLEETNKTHPKKAKASNKPKRRK